MSALAGLWYFDGQGDAADGCARMLRAQEVYGPDAGGQGGRPGIALGRRLMRTLPEDRFDRQPLTGGDGRFVLVADLRLDNRDDLIDRLTGFSYGPHRISNFEMETAGIYGLGKLLGHSCLSLSAIVANRITKEFSKDGDATVVRLIRETLGIVEGL